MIVTGSLIAAAALVLLLAPLVLTVGRWQVRHPRTALTLWFSALFAGIGLAVASAATVLMSTVGGVSVASRGEWLMLTVVGWLGLGVLAAVIAFVSASAEPLADSWREAVGRFAPVAVSREKSDGVTLVWFDSDEATACAVPSRDPEIFLSTALTKMLNEPQLHAVIEHERAHLRQHLPTGDEISNSGLIFTAYQHNVATQFTPVQRRLDELDLLNEWIVHIGSAVFAIPPGCGEGQFIGHTLFEA